MSRKRADDGWYDSERDQFFHDATIAVAFTALFLAVNVFTTVLVVQHRRADNWIFLITLMSSVLIAITIDLASAICMMQSQVAHMEHLILVHSWFKGFAYYTFTAALLLPVNNAISGQRKPGLVRWLLVALLAVLLLCTLILNSIDTVGFGSLIVGLGGMAITRAGVTFFTVVGISFSMARHLARRQHLHNRTARTSIILLIVSMLGHAVIEVVYSTYANLFVSMYSASVAPAEAVLVSVPGLIRLPVMIDLSAPAIIFMANLVFSTACLAVVYVLTSGTIRVKSVRDTM
ncbi:hypothetical protein BDV18DRAFT_159249 [Aspergillus unguis]